MKRVLFVCVHNAGRSQMAEAFFNPLAKGIASADSAGTEPSERVNPIVAQAMLETGIDIRDKKPQLLTWEMLESSDRVITMGCSTTQSCPASLVPTEDWELEDPEGQPLEKVRQLRDRIKLKVQSLVEELK